VPHWAWKDSFRHPQKQARCRSGKSGKKNPTALCGVADSPTEGKQKACRLTVKINDEL